MNKAGIKLAVAVSCLCLAIAYLGFTGVRAGWVYYLSVDDFAARAETHDARSRIHGTVGPGASVQATGFLATFELRGQRRSIPVEYHGAVPDMFAEGREVVVEGRTDARGVFVADVLLTKCGSKYQAAGEGG